MTVDEKVVTQPIDIQAVADALGDNIRTSAGEPFSVPVPTDDTGNKSFALKRLTLNYHNCIIILSLLHVIRYSCIVIFLVLWSIYLNINQ